MVKGNPGSSGLHLPAVGEVASVGRRVAGEPAREKVRVTLTDRPVANPEGPRWLEAEPSVIGGKAEEDDQRERLRLGSVKEPSHEGGADPRALP